MTERKPRARVLVVEDEAYVRDSLLELLRARDFGVEGASGVPEALALLRRTPVDVVLTDLRMPELTGLDLVRRMQETAPEVPVKVKASAGPERCGFRTSAEAVKLISSTSWAATSRCNRPLSCVSAGWGVELLAAAEFNCKMSGNAEVFFEVEFSVGACSLYLLTTRSTVVAANPSQ